MLSGHKKRKRDYNLCSTNLFRSRKNPLAAKERCNKVEINCQRNNLKAKYILFVTGKKCIKNQPCDVIKMSDYPSLFMIFAFPLLPYLYDVAWLIYGMALSGYILFINVQLNISALFPRVLPNIIF